eukprot:1868563-Pyramimonas_sp.AAC.1
MARSCAGRDDARLHSRRSRRLRDQGRPGGEPEPTDLRAPGQLEDVGSGSGDAAGSGAAGS